MTTALLNHLQNDFLSPSMLFRNLLRNDMYATPLANAKLGIPVDVYTDETGLHIEVSIVGGDRENLSVTRPAGTDKIKIVYKKKEHEDNSRSYVCKNISRKDIDLEIIVGDKFDLTKANVAYRDNMLNIDIPELEVIPPTEFEIQ